MLAADLQLTPEFTSEQRASYFETKSRLLTYAIKYYALQTQLKQVQDLRVAGEAEFVKLKNKLNEVCQAKNMKLIETEDTFSCAEKPKEVKK